MRLSYLRNAITRRKVNVREKKLLQLRKVRRKLRRRMKNQVKNRRTSNLNKKKLLLSQIRLNQRKLNVMANKKNVRIILRIKSKTLKKAVPLTSLENVITESSQ